MLKYRIIWTILELFKRKAKFIIFLKLKLPAKFLMSREYKGPSTEWKIAWEPRLNKQTNNKEKNTWKMIFKGIQDSRLWCGMSTTFKCFSHLSFVHFCFISTCPLHSLLTYLSASLFTYVNSFMRSPKLSPSTFDYIFPIKANANYHCITKLFKTDFVTFLFYVLTT